VNVSCALDPRSVSPLRCLSAYRSWAAQTSSSSTWALGSTALDTAMCSCQSSYYPWCARYQGNFSSFNWTAHRHATLCDFSSNAGFRSTGSLASEHTLIRLITGSGALSNSECTSRGCTTPTNWNSVCSKCGVTSTRASLTMQLMQLTSGASDTSSVCCRKQYAYLQSTVYKTFHFCQMRHVFDCCCSNLQ